jgi:hypothetical protein
MSDAITAFTASMKSGGCRRPAHNPAAAEAMDTVPRYPGMD